MGEGFEEMTLLSDREGELNTALLPDFTSAVLGDGFELPLIGSFGSEQAGEDRRGTGGEKARLLATLEWSLGFLSGGFTLDGRATEVAIGGCLEPGLLGRQGRSERLALKSCRFSGGILGPIGELVRSFVDTRLLSLFNGGEGDKGDCFWVRTLGGVDRLDCAVAVGFARWRGCAFAVADGD